MNSSKDLNLKLATNGLTLSNELYLNSEAWEKIKICGNLVVLMKDQIGSNKCGNRVVMLIRNVFVVIGLIV